MKVVTPGAPAVDVQVPLTDVQPLAAITSLTATERPITIVVIITYLLEGG